MGPRIITDRTELKLAIKAAIVEINEEAAIEKKRKDQLDKLYSINKVRKRLGKAHSTIKKLVKTGMIKTSKDGLISEAAIQEYLQNNK